MQLTARVQIGGQVKDQTHRVEDAAQHQYISGANVADGEHEDEQGQEQAVAVHQQLYTLSDWEATLRGKEKGISRMVS